MIYRKLGRTNLNVSIAALGTGGHSRIGQSYGKPSEHSVSLIKEALLSGINLIDTSEAYGTEEFIGKAIKDWKRADVIISSKVSVHVGNKLKTTKELEISLDKSLERLGTDYIDIYHFHGIEDKHLDYCIDELYPVMQKFKDQGRIRFIGITERFENDTNHIMHERALKSGLFDVIMVGFHYLNQSARKNVLCLAIEKNIGVLDMFAVRRMLADREKLTVTIKELTAKGYIPKDTIDLNYPLSYLDPYSPTEAAYRFCLSEEGIHSVLVGTGNTDHLNANIIDMLKGPLPHAVRDCFVSLFGNIDFITGN